MKGHQHLKYEELIMLTTQGVHEKVFEIIRNKKIQKQAAILDLGAGTGSFDKRLIDNGFKEITAVDIVANNYKYKNKFVKFLCLDLNANFSAKINKKFDLIIATDVIEHLASPHNFIKECKNLLKKEGTLIINTPNLHNLQSRINFLIWGYPSYFIVKPQKAGIHHHSEEWKEEFSHISPVFDNILMCLLNENNLELEKRMPCSSYTKHFKFYTKKSYFYFLIISLLRVLLVPMMMFNRKLLKGTEVIYVIQNKENSRCAE